MDKEQSVSRREYFHQERPRSQEERYESLKSLCRLVEYDMTTEMKHNRRVSLPVIDIHSIPRTHLRRRNSSVVDYMHELKSVRRKMIQRLLPDIEDAEKTDACKEVDSKTGSLSLVNMEKSGTQMDYDIVINTMGIESDSSQMSGANGTTGSTHDGDIQDSIEGLREQMARFEASKTLRRSVHADDFQQYLGVRYLEAYHRRRSRSLDTSRTSICSDHFQGHNGNSYTETITSRSDTHYKKEQNLLKSKLHKLAAELTDDDTNEPRARYRCTKLPQIGPNQLQSTHRITKDAYSNNKINRRNGSLPIYNDMEDGFVKPTNQKGIPQHAAKRAHMRYFQSHGLSSILSDLKNASSTTQKTEQEHFVNVLEQHDERQQ